MKKIAILTLINFSSLFLFSQENSILNIGAGYPFFFESNFSETGAIHQFSNRVHLFAEIPIEFGTEKNISLHPGVGYFLFKENFESNPWAMGGHSEKELKHNGINIHTRAFFHIKSKNENYQQFYFGGIVGAYLWSKTTGESSWWMMGKPNTGGGATYNQSGEGFFHSFYYGFIGGFDWRSKENARIAPAFEFSLYPDFATVNNDKKWMATISVILKIQKKATRINE